jgi:hypothetical protein
VARKFLGETNRYRARGGRITPAQVRLGERGRDTDVVGSEGGGDQHVLVGPARPAAPRLDRCRGRTRVRRHGRPLEDRPDSSPGIGIHARIVARQRRQHRIVQLVGRAKSGDEILAFDLRVEAADACAAIGGIGRGYSDIDRARLLGAAQR